MGMLKRLFCLWCNTHKLFVLSELLREVKRSGFVRTEGDVFAKWSSTRLHIRMTVTKNMYLNEVRARMPELAQKRCTCELHLNAENGNGKRGKAEWML